MNEDYIRVSIVLRQSDIDKLEQIIRWRDGKIRGDKSATIRMAINQEYNRLKILHETEHYNEPQISADQS